MKTYYEILQVDKNANLDIIKAVYKIHIKKNHPDLFQGKEKKVKEEEIKKITEAYEVLKDTQKREQYDKSLQEAEENEKALLNELIYENTLLKERLENNISSQFNESVTSIDADYIIEQVQTETDKNNTKYLMHLIWKERMLRIIIFVVFLIAIGISMYKVFNINILTVMYDALINTFGGNN